jgi:hypothetical protein
MIGYLVARKGNERNYIANLRINNAADSIEKLPKGAYGQESIEEAVLQL